VPESTGKVDRDRTVTHCCDQLQRSDFMPRLRRETHSMKEEHRVISRTPRRRQSFSVMYRHGLQQSRKQAS